MTILEFFEVSTKYVYGQPTLRKVSFRVTSGRMAAFYGPGADGQTEALRAVAGLLDVTAGAIRLNDADITSVTPALRPVRLIFQNQVHDVHQTVEAALGSVSGDADRLLEAVRLQDKIGVPVGELAAADRFMLHVARCLAAKPDVLLLEDSLALFSRDVQAELVKRMHRLNRLTACLLVYATSDRALLARLSAHTVVFANGTRLTAQ